MTDVEVVSSESDEPIFFHGKQEEDGPIRQRPGIVRQQSSWIAAMDRGGKSYSIAGVFVAVCMPFVAAAAYLVLFSQVRYIGLGSQVYLALHSASVVVTYVALGSFGLMAGLFILDIMYWSKWMKILGDFLIVAALCGLGASCLLAVDYFAAAPLSMFLFGFPIVTIFIKVQFFRETDNVPYMRALMWPLLLVAILALVGWGTWIVKTENYWKLSTKISFYTKMECEIKAEKVGQYIVKNNYDAYSADLSLIENATTAEDLQLFLKSISPDSPDYGITYEAIDKSMTNCTRAFLLWLSPFLLFAWFAMFAIILHFMIRAELRRRETRSAVGVEPMAQFFFVFVAISVLSTWVASSIAAAEMYVSTVIITLSMLAMLLSAVLAVGVFGIKYLKSQFIKSPIGSRASHAITSDWARGFLVVFAAPVFLVYLLLSFLRQMVRRYTFFGKTIKCDKEKKFWVTATAKSQLDAVKSWEWGSVLIKSLYIGIFFFIFVVGVARVTTVFLSWLNEQLKPLSLGTATLLFSAVGLTMFLLPPVPGLPVYFTGGVALTGSAEQVFGFWWAVFYVCVICFLVKLVAVVLQQKLIGELFGSRSVYIRSLVGINSMEMRSFRLILEKPGMNRKKVMILCGGPDWPTSVLTGVLKLNVWQMLLGTLPVFFLVSPVCVAGSLLLKAGQGGVWAPASSVSMMIALIIQGIAFFGAIHFVAELAVEKEEELKAIAPDMEVLEREEAMQATRETKFELNSWGKLPCIVKFTHFLAVAMMTASCYGFQLAGKSCFLTFEVTDSIDKRLGGQVTNLVKPLGRIMLLCFATASVYLVLFNFIQGKRANRMTKLRTNNTSLSPSISPSVNV